MLAVSVIGMIVLLGGLRGENPLVCEGECVTSSVSEGSKVAGKVYNNIKAKAERLYRTIKYVNKPEVMDSMKKYLDEHPSEKGQELYEKLISEYEILQEKLERLVNAAGNGENNFEELKSLIVEVTEIYFKVSHSIMILNIEFGFNKESLDTIEENCGKDYCKLLDEIKYWSYGNKLINFEFCY
ncbi:hypothetical protein PFJ87_05g01880 [Encephalitozoon hellem]|uniref:Spore wall protein n=1 Tax=Encephalitozoon hellem TaxID=27973 RepID=A0ABY8CIK3_ENCHE|nr:hypothetical protein PFJ87_05g01880 [Encephalitozoon hellem]